MTPAVSEIHWRHTLVRHILFTGSQQLNSTLLKHTCSWTAELLNIQAIGLTGSKCSSDLAARLRGAICSVLTIPDMRHGTLIILRCHFRVHGVKWFAPECAQISNWFASTPKCRILRCESPYFYHWTVSSSYHITTFAMALIIQSSAAPYIS